MATLSIGASTPEKTLRLTEQGSSIPLRYDSNDPQMVTVDTIAMGFGDPRLVKQQLQQVSAPIAAQGSQMKLG